MKRNDKKLIGLIAQGQVEGFLSRLEELGYEAPLYLQILIKHARLIQTEYRKFLADEEELFRNED